MDATDLKNTMTASDSATRTKKSRKEKISSNVNRVNHRFSMKNSEPSSLETSIMNNEENKGKADEDLEFVLNSLQPYLESLPSKASSFPARDLASLSLSAAIAAKHARDTHSRLNASTSIPSSARIGFTINGSKKMHSNEEFKAIAQGTAKKVNEFQLFLKSQIILAQGVELDVCVKTFQRIIVHNALQLSNNLIRYYKTKFIPHFASSKQTDEKLLSQIALSNYFEELTSLNNNECIQWVLDDDKESTCDSTMMARQDAKFLRYFCVQSKQELLDIFRNYISATNKDSTNKTMFNINLANKKVSFASLNDTNTSSKTIPIVKENTILPSLPSVSEVHLPSTIDPYTKPATDEPTTDAPSENSKTSDDDLSTSTSICSNDDHITDTNPVNDIPKPTDPPTAAPLDAEGRFPSDSYSYLTPQERKIVRFTSSVLEEFIPILTVKVFETYTDRIQDELAEAAALALYKNVKSTELSNDTNKIISEEQSIDAPTVDAIIDSKVNKKVERMTNQLTAIRRAHDKALNNIRVYQAQIASFNDASVISTISSTSASTTSTSTPAPNNHSANSPANSHPNSILKGGATIESQMKTAPTWTTPSTQTEVSSISTNSAVPTRVAFKDLPVAQQKEIKKQRQLRQKLNRKKRKLGDHAVSTKGSKSAKSPSMSFRSTKKDRE